MAATPLFQDTCNLEALSRPVKAILHQIQSHPQKRHWVIGLEGDLGAGKTTLFQRFYHTLQAELDQDLPNDPIQSPTFTYLKTYEGDQFSLWHVDAYRIKHGLWTELFALWDESLDERIQIFWVEWITLVEQSISPDIRIHLESVSNQPDIRKITLILP